MKYIAETRGTGTPRPTTPMPIAAERRVASYIVEGALFVAFTVGLYFASLEAYGIRLYALKTFGAPGGRILWSTACVSVPLTPNCLHVRRARHP